MERKIIDYKPLLKMISDKPEKHVDAYQDLCRWHPHTCNPREQDFFGTKQYQCGCGQYFFDKTKRGGVKDDSTR